MGNQESIIIPDLKKGQKITVMGKTLKGNCGFSVSENATGSSGVGNTTTNQTNIATVNSDGDVMISCTLEDGGSGMGITSVSVTGIDGETVLTKAQYLEEILLYAECVGNTKDGYAVLNKIRTRAGLYKQNPGY